MRSPRLRRLGLCAVLAAAVVPVVLAAPGKVKTEHYTGKVVPVAGLLAKAGVKLDDDAAPHWLALVTDDGKVYPLIKDEGARMFFKDPRTLNRPMRLTGRLHPGSNLLQVVTIHSLVKGELHEIFYWCDVCSIRRYEKKLCDCCGGPMELREEPVKN